MTSVTPLGRQRQIVPLTSGLSGSVGTPIPWLSGYSRRIKIPINYSSDGELTDFQVNITLIQGSGTNSAGNIYLNSGAQNWPYDVRFTTSDGQTLIDFFRQEYDSTDGTWVVEIPVIASSGTTDIYLYWGKSADTDASNAANTAKDGAGHKFGTTLDTSFWSTVSGSPTLFAGVEPVSSGTVVSNDANKYEAWPTIVRDSAGKLYILYRRADTNTHAFESTGCICLKTSTDDGTTWSSESVVQNTADLDDKDVGALIFSDGGVETLLIVWCEQDGSGNNIAYSKKAPISTLSWESSVAIDSTNKRATHGNPVLLSNGRILVPLFAYNDSGDYKVYSAYSDNQGDSWTSVLVGTDNTHQPNEGSIIELKTTGSYAGKVRAYFRTEVSTYGFYYAESTDYGATWGSLTLDSGIPAAANAVSPEIIRMHNGDILFIYTYANDIIGRVSQDECANWLSYGIIVDRAASEIRHYAKAVCTSSYMYIAWCTNLAASSDVYFNKIPWMPIVLHNAAEYIESDVSVSRPAILEARIKFMNMDGTYKYPTPFGFGRYLADYSQDCVRLEVYSADKFCGLCTTGSARSITSGYTKDLNWSIWRLVWASDKVELYDDSSQQGADLTNNIPSNAMKLNIGRTNYSNVGNLAYFEWIFARKYTANVPTWATPSTIEYLMSVSSGSYSFAGTSSSLLNGLLLDAGNGSFILTGTDVDLIYTGGTYILVASSGDCIWSGSASDLLKSSIISPEPGNLSLNGISSSLLRGLILSSESGAYSIDGSASLLASKIIACESNSFTVSGSDVELLISLVISASSGSWSIEGSSLNLLLGRLISCESGSFTLTGDDLALLKTSILSAESGSHTLSGSDITILRSGIIVCDSSGFGVLGSSDLLKGAILSGEFGSYAFSGNDVGLLINRILSSESSDIALTGQEISLLHGMILPIDSGSYNIADIGTSLLTGRILSSESGSYNFSGIDAILLRGFVLAASIGEFLESGSSSDLLKNSIIPAEFGSFTINGTEAVLIITTEGNYILVATSGSFNHLGSSSDLLKTSILNANPGSFTLSSSDLSLLITYILATESGSYQLLGSSVETLMGRSLPSESGNYSATGIIDLLKSSILPNESGSYTLNGQLSDLLKNSILNAESNSLTYSGSSSNLLHGKVINVDSSSHVISGSDLQLLINRILNSESGSLTLSGSDAELLRILTLIAGSGNFSYVGEQSDLLKTSILTTDPGTIIFTGRDISLILTESAYIAYKGKIILSSPINRRDRLSSIIPVWKTNPVIRHSKLVTSNSESSSIL